MKRMRGRHHHPGRGHHKHAPLNRSHVFDSNGPDVRLRGTSQQLFEKYLQLGRDATSAGDRVQAESYFQHAEHYYRILLAMQQAQAQQQHGGQYGGQQGGQYGQQRRPMPSNGGYDSGYEAAEAEPAGEQPAPEEAQVIAPAAGNGHTEAAALADQLPVIEAAPPAAQPQPQPQAAPQQPRQGGPRHRHPRGPRGGGEGGAERQQIEIKPGPASD